MSREAAEATRKDLKEGSPALYSTSAAAEAKSEPTAEAEAPADMTSPAAQTPPTRIQVNDDGTYVLGGETLTLDTLMAKLTAAPDRAALVLVVGAKTPYTHVIDAMNRAKSAGYLEIAVAAPTENP